MRREPYGLVIVPLGKDGRPTGVAFWCATGDEADRVFSEECKIYGGHRLILFRPSGSGPQAA